MFKENKRTVIITSIVTLLPVLIGIILWDQLPDTMATHFDTDNVANGFSSKAVAVFGLPAVCLLIHWFAVFVTTHDPKKQNINRKMFRIILWIVPVVSLFAAATMYPYNLGYDVDISFAAGLMVGLVLIIIGNYLPKARQNYTVGIRLPWTLADETNWNKTHRLGGYIWTGGGIITILLTLTGTMTAEVLIAIAALIVIVPFVYSWLLHKRAA